MIFFKSKTNLTYPGGQFLAIYCFGADRGLASRHRVSLVRGRGHPCLLLIHHTQTLLSVGYRGYNCIGEFFDQWNVSQKRLVAWKKTHSWYNPDSPLVGHKWFCISAKEIQNSGLRRDKSTFALSKSRFYMKKIGQLTSRPSYHAR